MYSGRADGILESLASRTFHCGVPPAESRGPPDANVPRIIPSERAYSTGAIAPHRHPGFFASPMWSLLRDRLLWKGLLALVVLGLSGYVAIDYWLMPSYTRHGVAVSVPDTRNLPYEQAVRVLRRHDLQAERGAGPYDPSLPREIVLEQNPAAHQTVKPGRRVYLTVNSGQTPRLRMPNLENLSRRQAINQIEAHQLQVGSVRIDSLPSPYKNTVTRQRPAAGDTIRHGAEVDLWISPGQGEQFVDVPDVRGIPFPQADSLLLLRHRLRTVLVSDTSGLPEDAPLRIARQRPQAGASVREGSEIRVTVDPGAPPADLDSVRAVLDSVVAVRDSLARREGLRRARFDSLGAGGLDTTGALPGGGGDSARVSPGGGPSSGAPDRDEQEQGGGDEIPRRF